MKQENTDAHGLLITIDGPAGAGKTTVSKMLSDRLSYKYIDTGALYRGVALEVKRRGVSPDDDAALETMCRTLTMRFERRETDLRLICNDRDITGDIRTPEITMLASAVSAKPSIRSFLLDLQREMGAEKKTIFEGRDMGTVVFPNADIKFYLDAAPGIRAKRRYNEIDLKASQTLADVEKAMKKRDEDDSTRKLAPLKPADDAIVIDATCISAKDVVEKMLSHITGSPD